jgi:hypothetical protein
MEVINFYLSAFDFNRVKDLDRIEESLLHHPQLVWVWSTYFRLKQRGYPVELCNTMPPKGVVVISAINFSLLQKPSRNLFLIVTVADTPPRFYSHVNVSQNPWQKRDYPNLFGFPVWRHIPHWPQPHIKERNPGRKERFENVAFFGHNDQLERSIQTEEFKKELREIGFNFKIRNQDFSDYQEVDVVIAIRSFSAKEYLYKPYTKLINAWMAGVPIIVGNESAFLSIKKSAFDFIRVQNKFELIEALKKLKSDKEYRYKMIRNGEYRATEFTEEKVLQEWVRLLFHETPVYYEKWLQKGKLGRKLFYTDLFVSRTFRSLKKKIISRL